MPIIVIADPETLPPELADNPDVVMIPPDAVGDDLMAQLDAASGGLLGAAPPPEGGEGDLDDEPMPGGAGDDGAPVEEDDEPSGAGDDPDPDEGVDLNANPHAGEGRHGRGRAPAPAGRSGRSPLAAWVGRR